MLKLISQLVGGDFAVINVVLLLTSLHLDFKSSRSSPHLQSVPEVKMWPNYSFSSVIDSWFEYRFDVVYGGPNIDRGQGHGEFFCSISIFRSYKNQKVWK